MRPLIVGAALLALCLALCAGAVTLLGRYTEEAAEALESAQAMADRGDYRGAAEQVRAAWETWEGRRGFCGVVLRHAEADTVHAGFRRLLSYGENAVEEEFQPACAELIAQLRHLAEAERPHYYNVW